MRLHATKGGLVAAVLAVSTWAAGCGLDVDGAFFPEEDGGPPPTDARADLTVSDGASGDGFVSPDAVGPKDGATNDASTDATMAKDAPVDVGIDAPPDVGVDAPPDVGVDAPPDAPPDVGVDAGCTQATGCFVLPAGWTVVAFDFNGAGTLCPANFTMNGRDVDEGSFTPQNGACTCDTCNVATQPSCVTGKIAVTYDTDGSKQCNGLFPPTLQNMNPGGCNTDVPPAPPGGISNKTDLDVPPLGPTGGTCSAPATPHNDKVTAADRDRVCDEDSPGAAGCDANGNCRPVVAPPFAACIDKAGDQACPAGFPTKHLVGSGDAVTCPACGCALSTTCTNTELTYYTDNGCSMGALPMTADGSCRNMGANGQTFRSYKYTATPDATCNVTGSAPAPSSISLTGVETVCCP